MVSTVWSVSCCCSSTHGAPRAQPFVKVGGGTRPPCHTESAPLQVTSHGNNFDDFSDDQLTKVRVSIGWSRFLYLPLNFYEASRFVHLWDGCLLQTQRTNRQTDKQMDASLRKFVCLFVSRWSLTLTHPNQQQSILTCSLRRILEFVAIAGT